MSKVYLVIDHVCEADIVHGVFSTYDLATKFIDAKQQKDRFYFEGPEICHFTLDSTEEATR